jgi:hypothetical protein
MMNTEALQRRSQQVAIAPAFGKDWTEITVRSLDTCGELASTTRVRSKNGAAFLDVSIEEYTGMTRRAKFTSVRLDEPAARELYALLAAKFSEASVKGKQ